MKKTAQQLLDEVNAVFGKGAVTMGSDKKHTVEFTPTGVPPIDYLLNGGLPLGRFVEIYGDFSSLKSYIGLRAIAVAQKRGLLCALIDTEHAYDPAWAEALGVDTEELIYKQPMNGEEAIDLAEVLIRGGVDVIVFDSVAAAVPQSEQEKRLSGNTVQPARLAALMSLAMRKLTAANSKTAVLWINQTRLNVGVTFGNPETVPGGKALPYYASYRVGLKKSGRAFETVPVFETKDGKPTLNKSGKRAIGQQIRATLDKSKLSAPFRDITFTFSFKEGCVDSWAFLANLALDAELIHYDRGYWWDNTEPVKKERESSFRGSHGQRWLVEALLPKVPQLAPVIEYLKSEEPVWVEEEEIDLDSLGETAPVKSKASTPRKNGSVTKGRGVTPTRARARSNGTVPTKIISTKSKTRLKSSA
jgi:recombination protein RecA